MKNKIYSDILFVNILLVGLFSAILILPDFLKFNKLQDENQKIDVKLENLQKTALNVNRFPPTHLTITEIFQKIITLGKMQNISNLEFLIGKKQPQGKYFKLETTLKFNALFNNNAIFIRKLQELTGLIKINRINIKNEENGLSNVEIFLTIYYRK